MNNHSEDIDPWYKQLWPWIIIGLPATAVIASLHMVYVAFSNQDPLVQDEYYKEGLAINQVKANDFLAKELGLNAEILFDELTGEVIIKLQPSQTDSNITLNLTHPFDKQQDFILPAKLAPSGAYIAQLSHANQQRWYLQLQNESETPEKAWRLKGEIDLSKQRKITLKP